MRDFNLASIEAVQYANGPKLPVVMPASDKHGERDVWVAVPNGEGIRLPPNSFRSTIKVSGNKSLWSVPVTGLVIHRRRNAHA